MKSANLLPRVIAYVLIVNLFAAFAVAPIVFAQESLQPGQQDTETTDAENLRLYLYQQTQNPQDKSIRFDLAINSQVNSDRVQLTWFVADGPSQWLQIEGQQIKQVRTITQNLSLQPGKQYIYSQILQPLNRGTTQLLIQVESFAADGRILATISKPIWTDSNVNALVISGRYLVISDESKLAQYLNYLRIFALIGVILIGGYHLLAFGYAKVMAWLERG